MTRFFFWKPIKSTTPHFQSTSSTETIKIFFISIGNHFISVGMLVAIILYLDPYML